MEPIESKIANRPKPKHPDRMMRFWEFLYLQSDIACWKADQAERYLAGVKE